ncbi:hypothetical protein BDV25DRAFT_143932 [Aspergillus avenaceus]|uniref:LisH domain-containing protein n=1 Tax=Aspergillus avenaceus TaxID=36643 RepID=A0A5N6TIM3_ASPAV|nr:hypothetical protein BDV25DRAFT_143932 [Aspergillus avenaceus]
MPPQPPPLASILIARFLRSNNYPETLDAFIREANLPRDAGQSKTDEAQTWTIENILEEKKRFDTSVQFERYGDSPEKDIWTDPGKFSLLILVLDSPPSTPKIIQTPTSSNILACSVENWKNSTDANAQPHLVATGADRQLHLLKPDDDNVTSVSGLSESPILSYAQIRNGKYTCLTNMSGQLLLQRDGEVLDTRKDHAKYAVKVVVSEDRDGVWIATAGWDSKIFLYRLREPSDDAATIGAPIAFITLASNPESMLFTRHPETKELILLASRRDSTHLYYYRVEGPSTTPCECELLGRQNLAPHSNAWVAFSPACLALSPHDPSLLAVATSTLPHMKVIIVRLLFPSAESLELRTSGPIETAEPVTQATQAMAALALQNREDAAIVVQANTFAPQTAYSTPQVVWRPDGSGVWVNGEDGVIRGVEAKTGKVVTVLKEGHVIGSKVRAIWAGWVDVSRDGEVSKEEWLVSGGFDKRLIVWRV